MYVLFELDTDGDEFIWIQVLKLSEETCSDPEHVVLEVLVVTVVVSIASLKVTAIVELTETEVAESAGEDEETVGAVESMMNDVIVSVSLTYPKESVTVIVQFEKVPSLKETKVIVLFPEIAEVVLEEQEPP